MGSRPPGRRPRTPWGGHGSLHRAVSLDVSIPAVRRGRGTRLRQGAVALAWVLAAGLSCTPSVETPAVQATAGDRVLSGCGVTTQQLNRIRNGYLAGRSGELQLVPRAPNFVGAYRSHSGPWGYLQEVPLFFYGPGRVPEAGRVSAPATAADVAPTLARHLGFDFHAPDGRALPRSGPLGDGPSPRVGVVVVWDGVGRNVLARHPRAWPILRSLLPDGAWFERATVGSSPSVTAAVHATLGTGAFPATHGRVANRFRFHGSMAEVKGIGPDDLLVPTLADLWDRSVGNEARVAGVAYRAWHLGMVGHGARFPGADHDTAILMDEDLGRWSLPAHDRRAFRPPTGVPPTSVLEAAGRDLDLRDGRADGRWRGEDLHDPAVALASPASVAWQVALLEAVLRGRGFGADATTDLLFTNFKQADLVAHRWGMESPRMADVVRSLDAALGDLVGLLDSVVGRGSWVLALTADHGSTPSPATTGATVLDDGRLAAAIRARFDADGDGRSVLEALSPSQAWLDRGELEEEGVALGDVARFIAGRGGGDLFAGVFPSAVLRRPRCPEP